MRIILKNKETLLYDDFKFRCCIGKNGTTSNKIEGDKKTPKGIFSLGLVFYRKDRIKNLVTKLRKKEINKLMGWCDDVKSKNYNKLIIVNNKIGHEKLFQKKEYGDTGVLHVATQRKLNLKIVRFVVTKKSVVLN